MAFTREYSIEIRLATPLLLLSIAWILHQTLKPYFSPYRHIVRAPQPFFLFRLFSEPKVAKLEEWMDNLPHQGLIRYYGLNNVERIYVASAETSRHLLVREAYKFVKPELQYVLAKNIGGNGLLVHEGEAHKKARKALNPAFSPAQLKDMYPISWTTSAELLDRIDRDRHRNAEKQGTTHEPGTFGLPYAPLNVIHAATIDILGRWAYSTDFNVIKDPAALLRPYIGMFKQSRRGQITFNAAAVIGPKIALKLPLRAVKTMHGVIAIVRSAAEAIVQQHLCTNQKEGMNKKLPVVSGDRQDLISTAMKANHFSEEDLVEQTIHILAAATETSVGTLSWIVHLLSRYPKWQSIIREEVRQNLPSPRDAGITPSAPTFNQMTHLNAFIKEVMRFHSINTIWWRQCSSPATIGGETIHPGTIVSWSPWAIARDPKHWGPDSRVFNPQRWINQSNGGATCDADWIVFGAGPRRCIGEHYAYIQMQALVAALVGRFEMLPMDEEGGTDEGHELGDDAALTLFKIMDGWKLRFREVERW